MQRPPFSALARVYDAIMSDIEYGAWADFVLSYARAEGLSPTSVLDLACGTGASSKPFAARGLRVVGVDASPEMLAVARRAVSDNETGPEVRFVRADLRDFDLGETFDLATCLFDSFNNLTERADLLAALLNARRHLAPGGLLAFDVNTRAGVRDLWEEGAIEGVAPMPDGREVHYHWSHAYDSERDLGIVQAFCRVVGDGEAEDGEEFVETHEERGYDQADLEPLLAAAGFAAWEFCEFPDYAPPERDAPRVWVFARNGGGE